MQYTQSKLSTNIHIIENALKHHQAKNNMFLITLLPKRAKYMCVKISKVRGNLVEM